MAVTGSGSGVSFRTFPVDKKDALAMLYLQNQDLSAKTPEEIAAAYDDAYMRIDEKFEQLRNERKQQKKPYQSIL